VTATLDQAHEFGRENTRRIGRLISPGRCPCGISVLQCAYHYDAAASREFRAELLDRLQVEGDMWEEAGHMQNAEYVRNRAAELLSKYGVGRPR
jgi:hypothetical protein